MKALILGLALVAASAAKADNFKCGEKAADAVKAKRLQYSLILTYLGSVKDPKVVGDYDYASKVRVSVLSRNPLTNANFKLDRPSFEAVAKVTDVMYNINASRTHGVQIGIYLDELDQTWMKLKGVRGDIRMNCASN